MHKLMRETHGNFKLLSKDITLYVHRVSPESVPGFPRGGGGGGGGAHTCGAPFYHLIPIYGQP